MQAVCHFDMLAQQTTCSVSLEDSSGMTIAYTYVQGVFCGAAIALVWVCTKMYVTAEIIFEVGFYLWLLLLEHKLFWK